MDKYTLQDIDKMLQKLRKKRYDYVRRYGKDFADNDLFTESGLFDKTKPNKVRSASELYEKYGNHISQKVAILESMLDRNYIRNVNLGYKESLIQQILYMGETLLADKLQKMTYHDFVRYIAQNKTITNKIKEMYENFKSLKVVEQLTNKKANDSQKAEIRRELLKLFGML